MMLWRIGAHAVAGGYILFLLVMMAVVVRAWSNRWRLRDEGRPSPRVYPAWWLNVARLALLVGSVGGLAVLAHFVLVSVAWLDGR